MATLALRTPARPTSNVSIHLSNEYHSIPRTANKSKDEGNIQRRSTGGGFSAIADVTSLRGTYNGPGYTLKPTSRWSVATLESYCTATSYLGSWRTAPSVIGEDAIKGERLTLGQTFRNLLQRSGLSPLPENEDYEDEFDWCGRGMHVDFKHGEAVPLEVCESAGHGSTASIDIVKCRRVKLARKLTHLRPRMHQRDLLKEVQALYRLRHAHIVRLVGTYRKGRVFAALLYPVADMDLAQYLEEARVMPCLVGDRSNLQHPEPNYLDVLSHGSVCLISALRYVHECGIKHMDIKPANILLKIYDPTHPFHNKMTYRLYLCDFGISQIFNPDDESQTETYPGKTPMYASPEVVMGECHGRASDIFSLGCVLAEMATVYSGMTVEFLKSHLSSTVNITSPLGYMHGTFNSVPYHIALDGLRSWVTTLDDMEINTTTILNMLQIVPQDRPSLVAPRSMNDTIAGGHVIDSRCLHDGDPLDAFEIDDSDENETGSQAEAHSPSRKSLAGSVLISSPKLIDSSIPFLSAKEVCRSVYF